MLGGRIRAGGGRVAEDIAIIYLLLVNSISGDAAALIHHIIYANQKAKAAAGCNLKHIY